MERFCYEKLNSCDGCQYICKTCDTKLKKKKIPCHAVWNKLQLFQFPDHIPHLNKLERVIIGKRILFSKIIIMPKGQFAKIKCAICNVPIEADTIYNILPGGIDSNGLIMLKLERKLCYRGHVLFKSVRSDVVQAALNYLKQNNPLYNNVEININNIPIDLLSLEEIPILREEELDLTNQGDDLEEVENPLDQYRISPNDSALIPTIPCEINEENIRVTSLDGLYLTGEYNASAIKADPRATIEYNNMRENYAMQPIDTCCATLLSCLTITLLNTRSLKKYAVDKAADEVLKDCDIIFLTETQVESTDDISTISDILKQFTIIHNIRTDKFCSLAACYKNTIDHIHYNDIPAVTRYFASLSKEFVETRRLYLYP